MDNILVKIVRRKKESTYTLEPAEDKFIKNHLHESLGFITITTFGL